MCYTRVASEDNRLGTQPLLEELGSRELFRLFCFHRGRKWNTGFTGYFPSACFSEHDARVDATSRTSTRGQRCTHCSGGAPTETQNVRTVYLRQTLTSFTILAQAKYGLGDPARASRPKQGIEDGRNRCLDTRQSDATAFVIRGFHSFSGFSTRLSPKISIRYDSR